MWMLTVEGLRGEVEGSMAICGEHKWYRSLQVCEGP